MAVECSTDPGLGLSEMASVVGAVDVSVLDESALQTVLSDVRAAQRSLDGLVIRIAARADRLAADGRCEPAEETVRGDGAVGSRQARREAARAKAAQLLPSLAAAVSGGEASGEHVDVIARRAADLTDEQRARIDFDQLAVKARQVNADTFDRTVKRAVDSAMADNGLADTNKKQAASEFRHWFNPTTGMGHVTACLDPERYEAVINAVEQHLGALASNSDRPVTKDRNLAARAFVELVTADPEGRDARGRLPHVTVVVDERTATAGGHPGSVRQTENGHDLSLQSVDRLCCDAVLRRVTLDTAGVPINVGRKYRTATDAQWAALKAVHDSCAWAGCDAPISWCQAHHIREWEHGGDTNLDNLVPLCSRHHHRVHEGQWTIKLLPDRTLKIFKPDGTHHTTVPIPQRC